MKKSFSVILAILALLIVVCFISCADKADLPPPESGPVAEAVNGIDVPEFSVLVNGIEINNQTLAECQLYSVEAKSVNSSGTESIVVYIGFAIKDILKAAGLNETYVWLEASASDGYTVTLTGDVIYKNSTLLAITKDGSPFAALPWLAPCSDTVTGNYLKNTASILVNTTEIPPVLSTPDNTGTGEELPEILDRTDKVEFAPYLFLVNGAEVTNATLAGVNIYKITAITINKSGDRVETGYTGYKLADVLKACGHENPAKVRAIANDGYETELSGELITSDYTLVAIEKDKELGEGGTIWLAPCSETASSAYCKLVVEILTDDNIKTGSETCASDDDEYC